MAQNQDHPQPSLGAENDAAAPPIITKLKESMLSNAVDMADKVRTKLTNYPHPIRTEPPLPHGFVEGALLGVSTYFATRPIRSGLMSVVGKSWPQAKTGVGIFISAGQVLLAAKLALYSAVMVGSHAWLSILKEYAQTPIIMTDNESANKSSKLQMHKSILADELCQEPIMQLLLKQQRQQQQQTEQESFSSEKSDTTTSNTTSNSDVTFMDWVMDPQKVVTDELLRAIASCQKREKNP